MAVRVSASFFRRIADAWRNDRKRIEESARRGHGATRKSLRLWKAARSRRAGHSRGFGERIFQSSAASSIRSWAASAARPNSRGRRFTISCCATTRAPRTGEALEMVLKTLRAMAKGGMHDQLGGGFHRYSVDERWFVPHFEKMLYDQAQLAVSYLEAFQITRDAAVCGSRPRHARLRAARYDRCRRRLLFGGRCR